jgi:hypothetical protein
MSLSFGFSLPAYQTYGGARVAPVPLTGCLLQEDDSRILQEDDFCILLTQFFFISQEDGSFLLQENDFKLFAS